MEIGPGEQCFEQPHQQLLLARRRIEPAEERKPEVVRVEEPPKAGEAGHDSVNEKARRAREPVETPAVKADLGSGGDGARLSQDKAGSFAQALLGVPGEVPSLSLAKQRRELCSLALAQRPHACVVAGRPAREDRR